MSKRKPPAVLWQPGPFQSARRYQCAEWEGLRLSVKHLGRDRYRMMVSGHVCGVTVGLEQAKADCEACARLRLAELRRPKMLDETSDWRPR